MAKKKGEAKITVNLPSGGTVEVPANASESELRSVLTEIDPSIEGAEMSKNEDGSISFVRPMGTKG